MQIYIFIYIWWKFRVKIPIIFPCSMQTTYTTHSRIVLLEYRRIFYIDIIFQNWNGVLNRIEWSTGMLHRKWKKREEKKDTRQIKLHTKFSSIQRKNRFFFLSNWKKICIMCIQHYNTIKRKYKHVRWIIEYVHLYWW